VYRHDTGGDDMSKYGNKTIEFEGIRFDSLAEFGRYQNLRTMENNGDISNLVVHPRFILQEPFTHNHVRERAIAYEADFSYYEKDGKKVIEDVKGFKTREYQIKRKLFLYKYPNVNFVEIAS
jgi:spore coat protein CotH